MKKHLQLIIIILFTFFFTMGSKNNLEINIKNSKELDISITGNNLNLNNLMQDELDIKKIDNEFIITKHINNIEEISNSTDINNNIMDIFKKQIQFKYYFKIKKGFIKNTYVASFNTLNILDELKILNIESEQNNYQFILNIPNKIVNCNADIIENNNSKLIWNLNDYNKNIEFEFELFNFQHIIPIIIGIVLLILWFLITLFTRPKKEIELNLNIEKNNQDDKNIGINMNTNDKTELLNIISDSYNT